MRGTSIGSATRSEARIQSSLVATMMSPRSIPKLKPERPGTAKPQPNQTPILSQRNVTPSANN